MLFIAYIEVIAQFVLSRSFKVFKQCFANALLAQWAGLRIGPARPLVQFPALFIFFHIFCDTYYDIDDYSVSFAAQRLYYAIATYSVSECWKPVPVW